MFKNSLNNVLKDINDEKIINFNEFNEKSNYYINVFK